jgi:hypothetical protein
MTNITTNLKTNLTSRLLGVAVATVALITPAIASAQNVPSYAAGGDQQIRGTISGINGTWNIDVADANGYTDSVELHQGTIINPTGLTLEPGMSVTIDGYPDGSNFDATEIDTPYQYDGPQPVAVYYGQGAWYPGYAEGYGPSFNLVFDLGSNRLERRNFNGGGENRQQPGRDGNARPVTFAGPQQQRNFAAPQQQRSFAAPQRQRSFAAPQQQRSFAAPQQQRSFAAPAARTANAAPRGGGDHRR